MASDNETQLLYTAYIKFHTFVIRFHMKSMSSGMGTPKFWTNFFRLSSAGVLAVFFSESVGTKWTDKMPLLPQRKSQPVLTAVNGGHEVSQTDVRNWKFYSMLNFTLCVGVQGYLLPCSLPCMISRLTSSTRLGTVNKYKTYFICLNMMSQTLYRTSASCLTCACQSYNSIMSQYSYNTTAPIIIITPVYSVFWKENLHNQLLKA